MQSPPSHISINLSDSSWRCTLVATTKTPPLAGPWVAKARDSRTRPLLNSMPATWTCGGFHSHGGSQKWMVFVRENPNLKWMIWGYPYFRKPPCGILQLSTGRSVVSLRPFSKNIFDIEDAMGPHENCHFRANEITQNNIEHGSFASKH